MPTTPNYALRYPASTDPADVPTDLQKLASDVDAALLTKIGGPSGIAAGETAVWNGSAWARSTVTRLGISSLAGYPSDGTKFLAGDGTWKVPPAAPVTTVFGRAGAVVAASGDYTAAQVTNAADKASGAQQVFAGGVGVPGALSAAPGAGTNISNGCNITSGLFTALNVQFGTGPTSTVSFFGRPAATQPAPAGTGSYTDAGTTVITAQGTFTGSIGASAYTVGDIVRCLKLLGLIAP